MDEKTGQRMPVPHVPILRQMRRAVGLLHPEVHISKCIKWESGCACPVCPVFDKLKLDREYYCLR